MCKYVCKYKFYMMIHFCSSMQHLKLLWNNFRIVSSIQKGKISKNDQNEIWCRVVEEKGYIGTNASII